MKSAKLDENEIALLVALEKKLKEAGHRYVELDEEKTGMVGLCWLTAQRATLYESRLMYHEGYVHKPNFLMRHAWNTLNGKLVDLQLAADFHQMHRMTKIYKAEKSYTSDQVSEIFVARKCRWSWIDEDAPATKKLKRSKVA